MLSKEEVMRKNIIVLTIFALYITACTSSSLEDTTIPCDVAALQPATPERVWASLQKAKEAIGEGV
jgi:hypothetical protein